MPYVNYHGQYRWVRPGKYAGPFAHGFAPHTNNLIRKLVFHECSVPFMVYVETFIPCFLKMILTITIPQADDIFRAQAEGMVEGRPGRGGRRRGHMSLVPLEPAAGPNERRWQQGLRGILAVTQPLETIGYGILLYGATEQFAHDWTSLLYNFEHCGRPPSTGPFQANTNPTHLPSTGTPQNIDLPNVTNNRAGWPHSLFNVTVPFGHYSVFVAASFTSQSSTPWYAKVGFAAPFSTVIGDLFGDQADAQGPGSVSCVIQTDIFVGSITGTTITWLYESAPIPVGIDIDSFEVSIYQFTPVNP